MTDLCPTDGFEPAATACSTGVECLVNEEYDGSGSCAGGGQGGLRIVQLERVGVDPTLIPEPSALLSGLADLTASAAIALRRRKERD